MKKIYKDQIIQYVINLILLLIAWGGLFRDRFGCDTLAHMTNPETGIYTWILNGRYLAYAVNKALFELGILATDYYKIFFILCIMILAGALCIVQNIFKPFMKSNIHSNLETIS